MSSNINYVYTHREQLYIFFLKQTNKIRWIGGFMPLNFIFPATFNNHANFNCHIIVN